MGVKLQRAVLPQDYDVYVFDLYGTLVDIRTNEALSLVWEKLALFYGYYGACYAPEELKECYRRLVDKKVLDNGQEYAHEASPEIEITEVFLALFEEKGVQADGMLAVHTGQFFRVLTTEYVRAYPGTEDMLAQLRKRKKKIYLLSNAQKIFTAYEMHMVNIERYFDDILLSSDYRTKKPDERFFRALLGRHAIEPGGTLFVGNDSRTDIGGARQVGMDTFYVKSNISPAGDRAEAADYIVEEFTGWETADE